MPLRSRKRPVKTRPLVSLPIRAHYSPRWIEARAAIFVAALIAGALLPLAFAPYNFYPLAVLSPAFLFWLWQQPLSPRRAALVGYAFGLGMFGAGVHWVYYSLHDFGNMNAPFAAAMVLLFVSILALYPALLGWLQTKLPPGPWRVLAFLPAMWTAFEWIRGWLLTGFPWLNLGYSQIDSPLAGVAPIAGVYAVSFLTALSAALLTATILWRARILYYFAASLVLWGGAAALGTIAWGSASGAPLRAALIQGNVSLTQKWQPAYRDATLREYAQLSLEQRDVDLIVWPETAVPAYLDQVENGFLAPLRQAALARGTSIVLGVVERTLGAGEPKLYNSVVVLSPSGGIYRKRHLVPFGEFLPFSSVLGWLLNYLNIPMSDFSAWEQPQAPLAAADHALGISICYEDAFGEELINALPVATVLINVSEDAWFGDSAAPHQHLQMARMRARETARPLLRATNTGVSAAIDAEGKIVVAAPQFQRDVVRATVQPRSGATPYVRVGNIPVVIVLFVIILLSVWRPKSP